MATISKEFNRHNKDRPFLNTGVMMDGSVWTTNVTPRYDGPWKTLGGCLVTGEDRRYITDDFFIKNEDLPKWRYLKGAKKEKRRSSGGHEFTYSEGSMAFPDPLDKSSRTIITSEGGSSPSRFKHVIRDPVTHRLRRLVPIELERLDMFPDNHTIGQSDTKRAFFMGNALVCGIIETVGRQLYSRLAQTT
ncbi:MAG: DNA cytosine methyltransferase [Prevotella sp.]|nr:DNA cytosine methyltransferase [Prevotella sp.]